MSGLALAGRSAFDGRVPARGDRRRRRDRAAGGASSAARGWLAFEFSPPTRDTDGGARRRRRQLAPRRRRPARRPAVGLRPAIRPALDVVIGRARRAQRRRRRCRAGRLRRTAAQAVAAHAPLELPAFAVAGGAYLTRATPLEAVSSRPPRRPPACSSRPPRSSRPTSRSEPPRTARLTARTAPWSRSSSGGWLVRPVYGYLSTHDVGRTMRESAAGERNVTRPPTSKPHPQAARRDLPGDLAGRSAGPARAAALPLLAAAALVAVSRLAHRGRRVRELATFELRLGRDDVANPYRVQEAFEAIIGALSSRWYERLCRGRSRLAALLLRGEPRSPAGHSRRRAPSVRHGDHQPVPILDCSNTLLRRTGNNEQRGLTRALINVRGVPLQFYNTHLHTTAADRLMQTADIAAVDAAPAGRRFLSATSTRGRPRWRWCRSSPGSSTCGWKRERRPPRTRTATPLPPTSRGSRRAGSTTTSCRPT